MLFFFFLFFSIVRFGLLGSLLFLFISLFSLVRLASFALLCIPFVVVLPFIIMFCLVRFSSFALCRARPLSYLLSCFLHS